MNLTDLEDMEEDFAYLQIGEVFARGEILVPGAVTRAMGWEPGTELMASRTDELLILQRFLPRCAVCGSILRVKAVRDSFLCEKCIQAAQAAPLYEERERDAVKILCLEGGEEADPKKGDVGKDGLA